VRKRTLTTGTALAVALGTAVAGALALDAGAAEPSQTGDAPRKPDRVADRKADEQRKVKEDFNGDGFQDLAVGAPENAESTGYITVVYGSGKGLDPSTRTVVDQDTPGVPGDASDGDRFGGALAAADLDGDGLTDLAVAAEGDERQQPSGSGSVTLLWGAKDGLSGKDAAVLDPGTKETYGLGRNLTAGDFDGDGKQDLAMQRDDYGVVSGPFTRDGKFADEQRLKLTADGADVMALVPGDVTGDGADDLVVMRAFEEASREALFFKGGEDGLKPGSGLKGHEGATGAIGDFDGDGYGDLAYRDVPEGIIENLPFDSGTVRVVYGSKSGPSKRNATFTQATSGVPGANEKNDQFGGTLSAGDVDGDGYDDLAAGVPFEAIGSKKEAGSFVVLDGGAKGLTGKGAQAMSQDFEGVPGDAAAGELLGAAVRLNDHDKDGKAELSVAAPGEAKGSGAVWSFPGGADGVETAGARTFAPGDVGAPSEGARFGTTFGNVAGAPLWGVDG
jgi:hypothetical protein